MTKRTRRMVLFSAAIGLTCAIGSAAWFVLPAVETGVGHTAKVICSGVFVSKRSLTAVRADLQVDDLRVLKYVSTSIDTVTHAVTAGVLGIVTRRAVFREGLGCTLELDHRNVLPDRETYLTFPRQALFDPIGMPSAVLETDAAGTFIGSSYMYATARDWARFGVLYLRDGVSNGARILPEGWVGYTATPAPADQAKRYGAHFWLEIPPEYAETDPRLPAPALHAVGHEGQFVTIVPSRDLVIVRLGRTRYARAWDHAAFVREVMSALSRGSH